MGLTDIHCHILPGIDDGAKTMDETRALLLMSAQSGVTQMVFTPHFYPERQTLEDFLEKREAAWELLRREQTCKAAGISARIGAEVHYTPKLGEMPLEQLCFSDTRFMLVELSTMYEPLDVSETVHRLVRRGVRPILAHVERFPYVQDDPELLYGWVRAGALAQVNAGAALRDKDTKKRLEQYFKWNLIHLMASDTHSVMKRPPNLSKGYEAVSAEMAEVFQKNAQSVFMNQDISTPAPRKPSKWFGFWR